jgi:hypothetical protein
LVFFGVLGCAALEVLAGAASLGPRFWAWDLNAGAPGLLDRGAVGALDFERNLDGP